MRNRKLQLFIILFLSCLFECPSFAFGSEGIIDVFQSCDTYYGTNYYMNPTYINKNVAGSNWSTFNTWANDLATYKTWFFAYTTNNSLGGSRIRIVKSNNIGTYNVDTKVLTINGMNKNNSTGYNLDTFLRSLSYGSTSSNGTRDFTNVNYYYIYIDGTVYTNNDSVVKRVTFEPSYTYTSTVIVDGVSKDLYVCNLNRPPSQWEIGTLYNFDTIESTNPPLFGSMSKTGKNQLFSFSTVPNYYSWDKVRQKIYVNSYSLDYKVVYYISIPQGNSYIDYYFLFSPLYNQAVIMNESGDYVFGSGDGVSATSEDYLANLSIGTFNASGDLFFGLDVSGDDFPGEAFYLNFYNHLIEAMQYSGDAVMVLDFYKSDGTYDFSYELHASDMAWDNPLIDGFLQLVWYIAFGYVEFKICYKYYESMSEADIGYIIQSIKSEKNYL